MNPGVSVSTTKPRTPSSVSAQTTATSATVPLVDHRLAPSSTQSPPARRAVVPIEAGSLPASGSVSAKHPSASPAAIRGSQSFFWSAEPQRCRANMANEPCTETKLRSPESTASSSRHASPYATALAPGHRHPCRCMPSRPSRAKPAASSAVGIAPLSYRSLTCGASSVRA